MAELIDVANAMFKNKSEWNKITDTDKERFFFIFNRYFAKMYPTESQNLNLKTIDKVEAMNVWYYFMKSKPYPQWFWSKSEKNSTDRIEKKDFDLLFDKLNLNKKYDLEYLIEHHEELIMSELKFYKTKIK